MSAAIRRPRPFRDHLTVARRCVRDERIDQFSGDRADIVDRFVEHRLVRLRWVGEPAELSHSDIASTFLLHSLSEGFSVPYPGRYRVTMEAYRYHADTPVILTLYRGRMSGQAASLDELLGTFDLVDDVPR